MQTFKFHIETVISDRDGHSIWLITDCGEFGISYQQIVDYDETNWKAEGNSIIESARKYVREQIREKVKNIIEHNGDVNDYIFPVSFLENSLIEEFEVTI